jgi:XrtN system VIT domain protein
MEIKPNEKLNDEPKWIYPLGYLLLMLSVVLFIATDYLYIQRDGENLTIFFLHYFLAVAYAVALLANKMLGVMKSWRREHIDKTIILLNLFLISAYALNRELPVFEDSTNWLCVFIMITSAVTLSYRFFRSLPKGLNILQHVLLGAALTFYIYLSIYVANFYILGSIGVLLFGIGAHIFIPIFLLIGGVALIKHAHEDKKISNYWLALGSVITLAISITFIIEWNSRISAIDRLANQSVLESNADLPVWVDVGQSIKNDWITERILKSNLVYTMSNEHFQWDLFPSNANWDEVKKLDPLVFLGSLVNKCSLSDETRIKILQSITDSRHRAQERLWSGDNLTTSYVVSDIDIYPDLRLAYTEKYLNIKNNIAPRGWWGSTEEAIYTFQLPEGSVVTSLSLWINDREEKSILTSKQKANEAYTTIVGKEARDPSVLHWQEGNTISVRIFPCTQQGERKFKVGITSPLPVNDGRVTYKNITFRGPNPEKANETVRVRFLSQPNDLIIPPAFEKNVKGEYILEHRYDPDLAITFSETPIRANQFSFDGYTYSMASYKPEFLEASFLKLYLDINNSWQESEIEELRSLIGDKEVYVYAEHEFIAVTPGNWNEITSHALKRNFSLFPFHRISDAEHSLVISKGRELSPYLRDIKESNFAKEASNHFAANKKIKLYNLTGGVSTYIRSFRELRGLEFANGSIAQLKDFLQNSKFPSALESDEKIFLHDSQMIIQKNKGDSTLKSNAPDHLARLFAYNDIMRKVGASYFKNDYVNEELVDEATTAYVVSPVSSLIVLETKEDYERFGIKDKDNSLHNASKQSTGAVPEPHEWALIVLFAALVVYSMARKYQVKLQH